MKKTILTLALIATSVIGSYAQGTITINNVNASYLTYTNGSTYSSSLNGVYNTSGNKTASTANAFYYALLVQAYTGTLSTIDPTSGNWQLAMYATNYTGVAGGVKGTGVTGAPTIGSTWGAPTGATYNTGTQNYYLLVGWSANLGTSWTGVGGVESQLASGTWAASGFFGTSALGNGYAGGGPNSLSAPSIFGTGVNAGGLTQGITLYVTPTPEPGTMALAALGGASLLLFRRRK